MLCCIAGKSFIASAGLGHLAGLRRVGVVDLDVVAVPNRTDPGVHTWEPSLSQIASLLGVTTLSNIASANLNSTDLVVSLEFDRLIKAEELRGARAYNLHFSLLPEYRGCLTSAWPLRHGRTSTGVTLHEIASGIDDGPIVDQIAFEIPPFASSHDLYLLYHRYGFELFKKWIVRLIEGKVSGRPQDESQASYYGRDSIDFSDTEIRDLDRSVSAVRNAVRSTIFPPYQLPTFRGRGVTGCEDLLIARRHEHLPGDLLADENDHVIVVCADGYLRLNFATEEGGQSDPMRRR